MRCSRGDLIEIAAAHTRKAAFGALRQQGNVERRPYQPRRSQHGMGKRDLQAGRRRQAGAARDAARNGQIAAGHRDPSAVQFIDHAAHIVAPPAAGQRCDASRCKAVVLCQVERCDAQIRARDRRETDAGFCADGDRHGKPVVVIGVFANQVDPPRRTADNLRRGTKRGGKPAGQTRFQRHACAPLAGFAARNRAAATSGVRSRCGSAIIS